MAGVGDATEGTRGGDMISIGSVQMLLLVSAFVTAVASLAGKCPVAVPVLLICVDLLLVMYGR